MQLTNTRKPSWQQRSNVLDFVESWVSPVLGSHATLHNSGKPPMQVVPQVEELTLQGRENPPTQLSKYDFGLTPKFQI